jgi:hypothetical protein
LCIGCGAPYSHREIEKLAGGTVSHTSIWKARKGQINNLSKKMIEALSKAFAIHTSYFFVERVTAEDIPRYQEQYQAELLIEEIALRAGELDEGGKTAILDMINVIRKAQGTHQ